MRKRIQFMLALVIPMYSCQAIKSYERIYLDDQEMQMVNTASKSFNQYVHSIREGAIPTAGTKSSGGCGCN